MRKVLLPTTILCFIFLSNGHAQKSTNNNSQPSKAETEKWILEKLTKYQTTYEVLPPINGNPRVTATGYKYSFKDQFLIVNYITMSGVNMSCSDSLSIDITNTNKFEFMANDNVWIQGNHNAVYHGSRCFIFDKEKNEWIPTKTDVSGYAESVFLGLKTRIETDIAIRFNKAIENLKSFYKKPEAF